MPNANLLTIARTLQPSVPDTISYLDQLEPSEPPLRTPSRKDWSTAKACLNYYA